MIFHQVIRYFSACCNFIGKPPADNRRMMVALRNQFPHLIQRILAAIRHVHCNVGDLRPDDHAVFITQIIKFLCVLVMCQPDRIRTDFVDQLHVFPVLCQRKGITDALTILMPRNTPQRITPTIEKETILRINFEFSAAKAQGNVIFLMIFCQKHRIRRIKIWIIYPIPKVNIVYYDLCRCISIFYGY